MANVKNRTMEKIKELWENNKKKPVFWVVVIIIIAGITYVIWKRKKSKGTRSPR